jgi:glycosyltransferase involved in cell wall biosynthesis
MVRRVAFGTLSRRDGLESAVQVSSGRIGLDARVTRRLSVGMKTYALELVRRLPQVAPQYEYISFEQGGNFGWSEQVRLPLAMRAARLDLMHFLTPYVPVAIPAASVITIHDLIHLRYPEQFKPQVGPYYRSVVRLACARAKRVITDDERTVGDLTDLLGIKPEKIRVVPLGVDERFAQRPSAHPAPNPYLLYVGNHREHKDLPTLFEAWSALALRYGLDLYVTGPDDFGGALQQYGAGERSIVALGDVAAGELPAYYAGARALVQPALREGFGLPILEAMAAGCPVVACEDALPGILAPAALTFGARDPAALSAALARLFEERGLRERLIERGRGAAQQLTWDRCARATADVYREVLEQP